MTIPSQAGSITTRALSRHPMASSVSISLGQIPVGTEHQPQMG